MPKKKIATVSNTDKDILDRFKDYVNAVKEETYKAFPGREVSCTLAVSPDQMRVLLDYFKDPKRYS